MMRPSEASEITRMREAAFLLEVLARHDKEDAIRATLAYVARTLHKRMKQLALAAIEHLRQRLKTAEQEGAEKVTAARAAFAPIVEAAEQAVARAESLASSPAFGHLQQLAKAAVVGPATIEAAEAAGRLDPAEVNAWADAHLSLVSDMEALREYLTSLGSGPLPALSGLEAFRATAQVCALSIANEVDRVLKMRAWAQMMEAYVQALRRDPDDKERRRLALEQRWIQVAPQFARDVWQQEVASLGGLPALKARVESKGPPHGAPVWVAPPDREAAIAAYLAEKQPMATWEQRKRQIEEKIAMTPLRPQSGNTQLSPFGYSVSVTTDNATQVQPCMYQFQAGEVAFNLYLDEPAQRGEVIIDLDTDFGTYPPWLVSLPPDQLVVPENGDWAQFSVTSCYTGDYITQVSFTAAAGTGGTTFCLFVNATAEYWQTGISSPCTGSVV